MDLKIDEIMELSLDDYIAMSMNSSSSNGVKNSGSSHDVECNTSGSSTDVKFGRRKGNIDDDEEEEDDVKNQVPKKVNDDSDIGIWKGPDSSISYLGFNRRQNDLREKLNNGMNVHKEKITPIQCRLKAPNNFANRPRGLPTLLPLESYTNKNSNNNNNRNGSKYSGGGRGGSNNLQRNLDFGFRKNFRQNNNGIGMSGISNGRVQRNRRQDIDSKNLRFSVTRDNTNINPTSPRPVQNMIVETPSNYINLQPSTPLNSSFQVPNSSTPSVCSNNGSHTIPVGNLTPQAEAKLSLNSSTTNTNSNNESLKSLLGFQGNVSGDMMPVFANRLLDFIQNGLQTQVHKPIYDMKIQKEIHELQGKPLLYKCPGGEVVSSDGAGVNCKIIPRTSGVSLNCRFA